MPRPPDQPAKLEWADVLMTAAIIAAAVAVFALAATARGEPATRPTTQPATRPAPEPETEVVILSRSVAWAGFYAWRVGREQSPGCLVLVVAGEWEPAAEESECGVICRPDRGGRCYPWDLEEAAARTYGDRRALVAVVVWGPPPVYVPSPGPGTFGWYWREACDVMGFTE